MLFRSNLACDFCQNYRIAQLTPDTDYLTYERLIQILKQYDSIGIAFTYNEPTVSFEYVYDISKKLKENTDYKVVLVTNGFIEKEPLQLILPYVDAMNIDLKSFNPRFYHNVCDGALEPIKQTITEAFKHTHVEITTLMVTKGVTQDDIKSIATFLQDISADIPLHISRYFPAYKRNDAPTNLAVIDEASNTASKYLKFVYSGNTNKPQDTLCKYCKHLLISRTRYEITQSIKTNKCPNCMKENPIVI